MIFEGEVERGFQAFGFINHLREITLVVSRFGAAVGADHPLILVDGTNGGSGSLVQLAQKEPLNIVLVNTTKRLRTGF